MVICGQVQQRRSSTQERYQIIKLIRNLDIARLLSAHFRIGAFIMYKA